MKKIKMFLLAFFTLFSCYRLDSYPTSLFWTTCTTDIVPTGMGSLQLSNYFTVLEKSGHGQFFPPDVGLTIGLFSWRDWKIEAGFDYLGDLDYPWSFNAKIGIDENKLFSEAPSFSIGIYDIGTRAGITNFNIVNANIGKTLPQWLLDGRLFAGVYIGTHTLGKDQIGYMLGYAKSFCPAMDCNGVDYKKWWIVADYASGKNFIGGGGVGLAYFFSPHVWVLTGPTWFNDSRINGHWKWTVQIDVLFLFFKNQI